MTLVILSCISALFSSIIQHPSIEQQWWQGGYFAIIGYILNAPPLLCAIWVSPLIENLMSFTYTPHTLFFIYELLWLFIIWKTIGKIPHFYKKLLTTG